VNLNGGADLSMADVNHVMEHINRQCENAQVLMGATVDAAFGERLNVTLIATRRDPELAAAAAEEQGVAESVARPPSLQPAADEGEFLQISENPTRNRTRLVPPPPELAPSQMEQALVRQSGPGGRGRKVTKRMLQGDLPLDVISRGRFDKTEPNFHRGEDLDTPTYLRRGCVLN